MTYTKGGDILQESKELRHNKHQAEMDSIDNRSSLTKTLSKDNFLNEINQHVEFRNRLTSADHFEFSKDVVFLNARFFQLLVSTGIVCLGIPLYFVWNVLVLLPVCVAIFYTILSQIKLYSLKQEITNPYLQKSEGS